MHGRFNAAKYEAALRGWRRGADYFRIESGELPMMEAVAAFLYSAAATGGGAAATKSTRKSTLTNR